jgi:hypothetical protein
MVVEMQVASSKAHSRHQDVGAGTETCSVERAVSRITGCDVMVDSGTRQLACEIDMRSRRVALVLSSSRPLQMIFQIFSGDR